MVNDKDYVKTKTASSKLKAIIEGNYDRIKGFGNSDLVDDFDYVIDVLDHAISGDFDEDEYDSLVIQEVTGNKSNYIVMACSYDDPLMKNSGKGHRNFEAIFRSDLKEFIFSYNATYKRNNFYDGPDKNYVYKSQFLVKYEVSDNGVSKKIYPQDCPEEDFKNFIGIFKKIEKTSSPDNSLSHQRVRDSIESIRSNACLNKSKRRIYD